MSRFDSIVTKKVYICEENTSLMSDKDTFFSKKYTLNCRGKLVDLQKPKVMGILNITPDSFFDGGSYTHMEAIEARIKQLIADGSDMIDIGAYSSRPGAQHIDEKLEWERLEPVLALLKEQYPQVITSVDTFRSGIARKCVKDYSVSIINDISAGEMDEQMFTTIAELQVPYIMMHMKGTPQNMQANPRYKHLMQDILQYFAQKNYQMKELGIHDVIIDPGFGFGKTLEHNYQLLKYLDDLQILGLPMLVGVSRKSMIYKLLGNSPDEALNGTTVVNTLAMLKGADILRVHDVKQARETIAITDMYKQAQLENWK